MTTRAASVSPSTPCFALRDRIGIRRVLAVVTASSVIVVVSGLIARDGEVPGWEEAMLRWFNEWPDVLTAPAWVIQQVGVLAAPVIGAKPPIGKCRCTQ